MVIGQNWRVRSLSRPETSRRPYPSNSPKPVMTPTANAPGAQERQVRADDGARALVGEVGEEAHHSDEQNEPERGRSGRWLLLHAPRSGPRPGSEPAAISRSVPSKAHADSPSPRLSLVRVPKHPSGRQARAR